MTGSRALERSQELRLVCAFAIQPFVAAMVTFAMFPVIVFTLPGGAGGGSPVNWLDGAVSVAAGAGVASLPITVFAALPLFLWMRRRGPVRRSAVLWGGVLLGNIPAALIVLGLAVSLATLDPQRLTYGIPGAVRAFLIGSAIGVACAAVFWWIAGQYLEGEA
jgi:hypothetical protein